MKLKTIALIALALPCLAFGSSENVSNSESSESSESSEETRTNPKTCKGPHETYVSPWTMCPLDCGSWPNLITDVDRGFGRCPNPCHCEKGYIREKKGGSCIPMMECQNVRNAVDLLREMIHGMYSDRRNKRPKF